MPLAVRHRARIGKGGSAVRVIEEETGTNIQVDKRMLECVVSGPAGEPPRRASCQIMQEGSTAAMLRVNCTGFEGAIIGPGGKRVRSIAGRAVRAWTSRRSATARASASSRARRTRWHGGGGGAADHRRGDRPARRRPVQPAAAGTTAATTTAAAATARTTTMTARPKDAGTGTTGGPEGAGTTTSAEAGEEAAGEEAAGEERGSGPRGPGRAPLRRRVRRTPSACSTTTSASSIRGGGGLCLVRYARRVRVSRRDS